jgi:hypothetical protein
VPITVAQGDEMPDAKGLEGAVGRMSAMLPMPRVSASGTQSVPKKLGHGKKK